MKKSTETRIQLENSWAVSVNSSFAIMTTKMESDIPVVIDPTFSSLTQSNVKFKKKMYI